MGQRAVIFIGPSRPSALATTGSLDVRPPARRGDVTAAAAEGFEIIGLVDGDLYNTLAVTPTEVQEAAHRVRVYGAASLGALRACECPDVIGIGKVYEQFANGDLDADDEVVGTYEPGTYRSLAYPLVVIREALASLDLDEQIRRGTLERIRALPFDQRDEATLARIVNVPVAALRAALRREPNVKQRDAMELVRRVMQDL